MTHKTEMVSVPRELLEDLLSPCADFATHDRLRSVLDAPAEDVREVVDDPVVYQVKIHGMTLYWNTPSEASKAINTPLYSHPQRKVVMPERMKGSAVTGRAEGWNACLDEFARLNK